jgi:hypothetical protein
MDTENRINTDGDQGSVKKGSAKGSGSGSGSGSGTNTSTSSTTGTGTGTGNGSGTSKEIKVSKADGVPVISINTPDSIPAPAELPTSKKKSSSGGSKKKDDLDKTLEGNVRILIGSGFGFAAKLTKSEIWTVSDEEAESISTPLTRILQRLGINESMNKYADYIALLSALTIITVPRVMIYQQMKQLQAEGGQQIETAGSGKKKADKKPAAKVVRTNPAADGINGSSFKAALDVGL